MRTIPWVLLALLAAGCLDDSGPNGGKIPAAASGQAPEPTAAPIVPGVDPTLPIGSIKGRILSDEQLPVPNITVILVGFNVSAVTDAQGNFFFNDVNVGDYFLIAKGAGYKEKQLGVQVREAETTEITLLLDSVPRPVMRTETLLYRKSLNCRFIVATPLSPNGADATGSKRTCPLSVALGSEYIGDYRQEIQPTLGLVGAIYEIKWNPSTSASSRIEFNVSLAPMGTNGGFEVRGTSPQYVIIKKTDFENYLAASPKHRNYEANGGTIIFYIEVAPSVTQQAVDAGIAIEQNVDAAVTHFYVTEPSDYNKLRQYQ